MGDFSPYILIITVKTKGNEFQFKVCKLCWDLHCQGNFTINSHQNKDAQSQKLEKP